MLEVMFCVIVAVMVMLLVRAALGGGLFNRLLAINSFGTLTVLLLVLFGTLFSQHDLLDIALLYALVNFVGPLVVLRFFENHRLPGEEKHLDSYHD